MALSPPQVAGLSQWRARSSFLFLPLSLWLKVKVEGSIVVAYVCLPTGIGNWTIPLGKLWKGLNLPNSLFERRT